jgi:hypothetical protein
MVSYIGNFKVKIIMHQQILPEFKTERLSLNHVQFILQTAIKREEEKLQCLLTNIERMEELAVARYSSKNTRGAILSMRKYHKLLEEYQLQTCIVPALRQLDDDITRDVVPLDQFDREFDNIMHIQVDDMVTFRRPLLKDNELLFELITGNFMQRSTENRQEKSLALTNPAA